MRLSKIKSLLMLILFAGVIIAQGNGWSVGFGASYPRFMGVWSGIETGDGNYGAYVSVQRSFTEHYSMRFLLNYSHLEGKYIVDGNLDANKEIVRTNLVAGNLSVLYRFIQGDVVTVFGNIGIGAIYFKANNPPKVYLKDSYFRMQGSFGLGAEIKISTSWAIKTEMAYHTTTTSRLDGENDTSENKGVFGTDDDSYAAVDVGFTYYIPLISDNRKSEKVLVSGVNTSMLNIKPDTVLALVPRDIIKKVIVEKEVKTESFRLSGVNFDFNSAELYQEYHPVLSKIIGILEKEKETTLEIQGHTDYIGTEEYNMDLSLRRAKMVQKYFVENGIDQNRITVKGFGKTKPISDNTTERGRMLNRRIELELRR